MGIHGFLNWLVFPLHCVLDFIRTINELEKGKMLTIQHAAVYHKTQVKQTISNEEFEQWNQISHRTVTYSGLIRLMKLIKLAAIRM